MARNGRRMNPLFLFVSGREVAMWEIINNTVLVFVFKYKSNHSEVTAL